MNKTFDVVIVNWNSATQLKECLESIVQSNKTNCIIEHVIVVDNASSDSSLMGIENLDLPLNIIKNSENLGFGSACNQGALHSKSDFILFLNPDMLVYEDTFLNLFNYIDKHDSTEVGIYGIQLQDENKNIQRSCARFPSTWNFFVRLVGLNKLNSALFKSYHMEEWKHDETAVVDHVIGAFYLIKKDLFDKLKGFDERYFVYIEDLDLSKRVCDSGFKTKYIVESQAYHKGGGTSENVKAKRLFYSTRSRLIYAYKNFGFFEGMLLMILTFIIEPISRSFFLVIKRQFSELPELVKGFMLLYKDTLQIIKKGNKK